MGSLILPLGPDAHTTLCVPSKSGVSVSPSPVKVLQSNPTSLQSLILWEFLLPLPDPQVGKPDVGLRTFTSVGGLLLYNCSPVCESPVQRLWDLILLWLSPASCLIAASPCLWIWGIFFGEFQCLPVDDCLAVSLWFQCSCKREWAHVFLLCHLEPLSFFNFRQYYILSFYCSLLV